MMILQFGDMWSVWLQADLFLVTANACTHIDQEGLDPLVMGAGIPGDARQGSCARQARDRFAGLDVRLSQVIRDRPQATRSRFYYRNRHFYLWQPPYHLLISPRWPQAKLGLFQTKERFCDPSSLTLIEAGVEALRRWCVQHPRAQVLLERLPGNVQQRLPVFRGQRFRLLVHDMERCAEHHANGYPSLAPAGTCLSGTASAGVIPSGYPMSNSIPSDSSPIIFRGSRLMTNNA